MSARSISMTTPHELSRSPTPPGIPVSSPASEYFQNRTNQSGSATPKHARQSTPGGRNKQFHPHHLFAHPFFSYQSHPGSPSVSHHKQRPFQNNGFFGRPHENAVGVFESQRFLNLEARTLTHPYANLMLSRMRSLLAESASDLLVCCAETLEYTDGWLKYVPTGHITEIFTRGDRKKGRSFEEAVSRNDEVREKLQKTLDEFRFTKR